MEEHFQIIKNHKLFYDFSEDEIEYIFNNFEYYIKDFSDREKIIHSGTILKYSVFVISGEAFFELNNFDGSRNIYEKIKAGNLAKIANINFRFPERFDLISSKNSTILFLNLNDFFINEMSFIPIRNKLLKNIFLLTKIRENQSEIYKIIISERSTRRKICRFLEFKKEHNSSNSFDLGCSRADLADLLAVDKSSLSRELSNLKKEGFIDFSGNNFTLIKELF